MAQNYTTDELRTYAREEVHDLLTGLVNDITDRGKQFNVWRDFGPSRYDDYHDAVGPVGDPAVPALQEVVMENENECLGMAGVLVEAYVGGMRVNMGDVELMLDTLDKLTVRREPVKPGQVDYHAEDLDGSSDGDNRRFLRASCGSVEDPELTRAERVRLCDRLALAGDNPSNPRATALVKVLESRWDL